ncbi:MAG: carbonic anhydrase family protein [Pseudomonadales bacterium]
MIRHPLAALTLSSLLVAISTHADDERKPWGYAGAAGPERWGDLDAAYETCKVGLQQSPIDLATANAIAEIDVSVDYEPGPLTVSSGKTVQVDFPHGSYLTTSGQVFRLVQVHFHTPSEHTFAGETYPLVAHFVHVSHAGELAVLGVLFEEGAGNAELGKIIDSARSAGTEASEFPEVTLHPRALVPEDIDVFRYMGSLTTPPCSEGVNWHVVETPLTAGADQIDAFESMMGNNARPVLPTNGRLVVAPE